MRPILLGFALAAVTAPAALAQAPAGAPKLAFPLACQIGKTCEVQHYVDRDPGPGRVDYHCGLRTEPQHNAIDIRLLDLGQMRRGVAVLAAAPGRVVATRDGVADNVSGAPLPKAQQCGNRVGIAHGGGWITDYCHLERGTLKVKMGETVQAGQPIAEVGMSGGTEFPHLHMSLQHGNTFVDPFAPAPGANPSCGVQAPLWTAAALRELGYKPGAVLVAGLSGQRVGETELDNGTEARFTAASPLLVLYTRLIGLDAGDVIELALTGPKGETLAHGRLAPLPSYRDQSDPSLAHARPAGGWPHGAYGGVVKVWRGGKLVIEKRLAPVTL